MDPMKAPNPSKEEIGSSIPEKLTLGRIVIIQVPKIADVWLLVKDETRIPIEVDAITKNTVPTKRVKKLPLTGTSKRVIDSPTIKIKLINPRIT